MRNIIHRCSIIATIFFLELSGICAQAIDRGENKLSLGIGIGTGIEMEQVSRIAFGLTSTLRYAISPKSSWILRSHYFRHISSNTFLYENTTSKFLPITQWQVALGWETALFGTLKPDDSKLWGLGWAIHAGYSQSRYTIEDFDFFPGHKHYNYTNYRTIQYAFVLSSGLSLFRSIGRATLYLEALPQMNISGKANVHVADGSSNPEAWTESYSLEGMEFSGVMINLGYRITW